MKIIVDHRERASGIIKELAKNGFDVEVRQLITADYIIEGQDRNGNRLTIGIERKVQSDFLNSIIDKRIIQQLIYLKENFSAPLLIIEGSENIYTLRNFHPNAVRGMMAAIAIDFQIPIIHTKNMRDTAALLEVIARRLEKPRSQLSLLKKRKPASLKEQQEYIVESLPLIGPQMAKALLKNFKSVKNIFNASEDELLKMEKMGKKKIEGMKSVIEKEYQEDEKRS
ncbi:MAG: ERCC4 domain-containing protein, partial [Nanoarchaeota archaeon]